jgi:hypothetical protein
MLRSIFYSVFVTLVLSGGLASQASAGKSGSKLMQAASTGKHLSKGIITARTTTGSPGPKGNAGASPRDASTGLPTGKRR